MRNIHGDNLNIFTLIPRKNWRNNNFMHCSYTLGLFTFRASLPWPWIMGILTKKQNVKLIFWLFLK